MKRTRTIWVVMICCARGTKSQPLLLKQCRNARQQNISIQHCRRPCLWQSKRKSCSNIPEFVKNEQKFGVISVAEFNFVMKLSSIALFLQMSTIIPIAVKVVAGADGKR